MAISRSGSSLHCFEVELEFGNVGASGGGDANVLADNVKFVYNNYCNHSSINLSVSGLKFPMAYLFRLHS